MHLQRAEDHSLRLRQRAAQPRAENGGGVEIEGGMADQPEGGGGDGDQLAVGGALSGPQGGEKGEVGINRLQRQKLVPGAFQAV